MPGQNKSGGGSKKIGRDKVKCSNYLKRGLREKAKIVEFKKHNIPKNATEEEKKKLISEFKNLQDKRKKVAK